MKLGSDRHNYFEKTAACLNVLAANFELHVKEQSNTVRVKKKV